MPLKARVWEKWEFVPCTDSLPWLVAPCGHKRFHQRDKECVRTQVQRLVEQAPVNFCSKASQGTQVGHRASWSSSQQAALPYWIGQLCVVLCFSFLWPWKCDGLSQLSSASSWLRSSRWASPESFTDCNFLFPFESEFRLGSQTCLNLTFFVNFRDQQTSEVSRWTSGLSLSKRDLNRVCVCDVQWRSGFYETSCAWTVCLLVWRTWSSQGTHTGKVSDQCGCTCAL